MSCDLMQQTGGSIDQTGHRAAIFCIVLYINTCFLTKKNIYNRIYIVLFASSGPGLNQQGQLTHTDTVIDQQPSGKKHTSAQNTRHTHTLTLTLTLCQKHSRFNKAAVLHGQWSWEDRLSLAHRLSTEGSTLAPYASSELRFPHVLEL